jgi:hypothetical protein
MLTLPRFSMAKLALANAALTLPSAYVVVYGASEEPFVVPDFVDFSVCVLAGGMLVLLWIAWAVAGVASARAPSQIALGVVLGAWAALCVFYLSFGVTGYFDDLAQFEHLRTSAPR